MPIATPSSAPPSVRTSVSVVWMRRATRGNSRPPAISPAPQATTSAA